MIFNGYVCRKFDNDDLAILLVTIAITIFCVGRYQRVRYKVICSVIVVVGLVLSGLLWWAFGDIAPC